MRSMAESPKVAKLKLGWMVFAGLIVLTLAEYWVASMASGPIPYPVLCGLLAPITWLAVAASRDPLPYLALIAIGKAALIVRYFMHLAKVWAGAGEGGH